MYYVIKRIKGIPYVYTQETYRVGEKVHTKSRYLGRASAEVIQHIEEKQQGLPLQFQSEKQNEEQTTQNQIEPIKSGDQGVNTTKILAQKIEHKIDFKRYNVSTDSLNQVFRNLSKQVQELGIDPSTFPKIKLHHESTARILSTHQNQQNTNSCYSSSVSNGQQEQISEGIC